METILNVNNLCKDKILNNISFKIEERQMVAVMGPSGSGKSTLLYQVSGMDQASSGSVQLKNTELTKLSEDELAKIRLTRTGFIFQQMNMVKNLSILDNILLPAYHAQKGKKKMKESIKVHGEELMRTLGISELAERKITEVSGGQLQRACICRSMINDPEIIYADEPTGALNQSAAAEVMEELQKLNKQTGTTVLIVTHDCKVASKCDRILYLIDGKIQGELKLGHTQEGSNKEREERVTNWLAAKGW